MPQNSPAARVVARIHFRGIVTTMLLMALSLLIARDILVRRISTFVSGAPRTLEERMSNPEPH